MREWYAGSSPTPEGVLRGLKQPMYDTERYPAAGTRTLTFFSRPLGQEIVAGTTKSLIHTNMQAAGQLGTPLEFDLFGFRTKLPRNIDQTDYQAIYNNAVFTFTFGQSRPWLQVPLSEIPAGVDAEGFTGDTAVTQIHNGTGHVSNYYNFTIGKAPLRIHSTETFKVEIDFPTTQPTVTAARDITVYLIGILYIGL